jgi:hypothetical protein
VPKGETATTGVKCMLQREAFPSIIRAFYG